MFRRILAAIDLLISHLWGWSFLLGGVFIVATALVVPPWLESRELAWQRDVLKLQAQRMAEQERDYRDMLASIRADDPVLIERLAYHYLRLKPQGVNLLTGQNRGAAPRGTPPASPSLHSTATEDLSTIDAWLHRPMPKEGVDYQPLPTIEGRILRLTDSHFQSLVLVGGALCMAIGLFAPAQRSRYTMRRRMTMGASATLAAPRVFRAGEEPQELEADVDAVAAGVAATTAAAEAFSDDCATDDPGAMDARVGYRVVEVRDAVDPADACEPAVDDVLPGVSMIELGTPPDAIGVSISPRIDPSGPPGLTGAAAAPPIPLMLPYYPQPLLPADSTAMVTLTLKPAASQA